MPARALTSRRDKRPPAAGHGLRLGIVATVLALLTVVLLAVVGVVLRLAAQLPDVGRIEAQFGLRGAEAFRPLLVFDRSGEALLYRHLNPAAEDYEWVELADLPDYVAEATVAAQDPGFWSDPQYRPLASIDPDGSSISERLVRAALLPATSSPLVKRLSGALLATELAARYPKEQILEWFLNSADYGRAAYGIDAAALVYFGKHAAQLNLSEAAVLAGLAADPTLDPGQQPLEAAEQRERVLLAMPGLSSAEAQRAASAPMLLRAEADRWERPGFSEYLLAQLEQAIGREALGRSGLRVISTLDEDLQDQSACAAESHIQRLSGAAPESTVAARGQRSCVSAALLPTLRPGDAGVQHRVEDWALVILNPESGELLAAHGAIEARRSAGPVLDPFIYLTAFTRGSAPASMVLDLAEAPGESHGPVRMRTALANLYPGAAGQLLSTVGAEAVRRTMSQFGLVRDADPSDTVALLDLTSAYGVFAAGGLQTGFALPDQPVRPSILREVREADGVLLFQYSPSDRAILGPQLAYLLVDVLSDEAARWPSLGQGNLLEVGFPTGVVAAGSETMESNWTVGYSPQRVVGVWLGGSPLQRLDRLNGAASIWHAVMRFASANLSRRGWERPPGMSVLEVCDPSGLLATSYCPSVVREIFAPGSEPTHFDNLYRPVRVNRETGKLATLFTPLELVEERVYFVPPVAAGEWAEAAGIELPPDEYDPLSGDGPSFPGVGIRSPDPFEILGDEVAILGQASPEDFEYYRLQYGQGLNPAHWVQIGGDQSSRVSDGRLGTWPTQGLNGLYTLQLLVILNDGQVRTAAVPVTLDNQPPEARLVSPMAGDHFSRSSISTITLQAEVLDDVAIQRVEFLVDGRRIATVLESPFSFDWRPSRGGEFSLRVRAYDAAGNRADSPTVVISIDS